MGLIELCEPCEWAGEENRATHTIGIDYTPVCDFHYDLDKAGRLGNWVAETVKTDVSSGTIKMTITESTMMNELGIPEELTEDKTDDLLFGKTKRRGLKDYLHKEPINSPEKYPEIPLRRERVTGPYRPNATVGSEYREDTNFRVELDENGNLGPVSGSNENPTHPTCGNCGHKVEKVGKNWLHERGYWYCWKDGSNGAMPQFPEDDDSESEIGSGSNFRSEIGSGEKMGQPRNWVAAIKGIGDTRLRADDYHAKEERAGVEIDPQETILSLLNRLSFYLSLTDMEDEQYDNADDFIVAIRERLSAMGKLLDDEG